MRSNARTDGYELVKYRKKFAVAIGRGKDRRRYSTGTDDPGRARVIAQQIWQDLNAPASERVVDLWKLYLADRRKDGRNVTRQENAWKRLEPVFGHFLGTNITKDDCRDYASLRRRHGAAVGTIKIELEYLRACLNLRYGRGNNHVWTPPASAPRDRYLTREEVDTLLKHVSTPHVKLFIISAITTGARMSAILELQWEQVDFRHRVINFNQEGREQTNKRRPVVPLNARAYDALEVAARGALTDYVIEWNGQAVRSIKKAIRMAAKRSGVPCSPHVFRHTAGVWMAQADVPMHFKPRVSVSGLRNRALCDVFFGMRAMERAGTGLIDVEQMLLEYGGDAQFKHESSGARFSALVLQPLASSGSKDVARDARPREIYVINFIPFISLPEMVSMVKLNAPWSERPRNLPLDEAGTFALQGDNYVWSFAPLPILRAIFGPYADQDGSRAWRRSELEADPDTRRVLSNLLRRHSERHLRGFTMHGLTIENGKDKGRRAYFEGNDGRARCYVYDSPARKNIHRWVVKQRGPDGYKSWFENEGFGYEVAQMDGAWGVRIKPFYMFTGRDAKRPLPSFARTSRATRRMKLDRNQNVENDLTFWGRFLSRGAQTINIGHQHVENLLLGGAFLTVEVVEEEDTGGTRQNQNPKAA